MKYTVLIVIFCIARVHFASGQTANSTRCMYQVKTPKIQFLTPCLADDGDGPFFNKETNELTYVDTNDIARYSYDFKSASFSFKYHNNTEGKRLAFAYPTSNSNIKIIGAGNQVAVEDGTKYTPINVTTHKGYVVTKGHADNTGALLVSMNSQYDKLHNGGRLYKYMKPTPKLLQKYVEDVGDFAWNFDYTKLYVAHGCHLSEYTYNNQDLSNGKLIFTMPKMFLKKEEITGLETDIKGQIWATVFGGYLINLKNENGKWKIGETTLLPLGFPTGLTFGGHKCNALIITTSKMCCTREYNAGSVLYVTGLNTAGNCDNLVNTNA